MNQPAAAFLMAIGKMWDTNFKLVYGPIGYTIVVSIINHHKNELAHLTIRLTTWWSFPQARSVRTADGGNANQPQYRLGVAGPKRWPTLVFG